MVSKKKKFVEAQRIQMQNYAEDYHFFFFENLKKSSWKDSIFSGLSKEKGLSVEQKGEFPYVQARGKGVGEGLIFSKARFKAKWYELGPFA